MRYGTIDTETTLKNVGEDKRGVFAGSPFHPDNRIVYLGQKELGGEYKVDELMDRGVYEKQDFDVLIGHNIKFDLHYLHKHGFDVKGWIQSGGMIWDTMVAEYMLTGQHSNSKTKGSLTLDTLAEKYGQPLKDSNIKEYFNAGMGADEIPPEEILPYLQNDVEVTEAIFLAQTEAMDDLNLMPLAMNMMDATLATWVMEHEGSKIDTASLKAYGDTLHGHIKMYTDTIQRIVEKMTGVRDFNPGSDQQLSALFFGGILKYNYEEVVNDEEGNPVRYKSGKRKGQIKTRKAVGEYPTRMVVDPKLVDSEKRKVGHAVTDEVLQKIAARGAGGVYAVAEAVIKLRTLTKELSTYVNGYLTRVWHDGLLHPEYSTTMTETGRLSCRNPNLQNIKSR
jgi:DNA polymerase I-like protein with 3'-5' exonuclease and polymerase domains